MKTIFYSRRGLSLVEVLIAIAILGIIATAISSVTTSLKNYTQQFLTLSESSEFVKSLSNWMLTTDACQSSFVGQTLPATPTSLILNGYKGFGAQTSVAIQTGSIITPQLRVKKLTYYDKDPTLSTPFVYNQVNLQRKVAIISLSTETLVEPSAPRQLRTQNIELPVLVDATQTIQYCLGDLNLAQACAASGGAVNPVTGQCLTKVSCEVTGTYSLAVSSPATYCCGFANDPNPTTGTASCPPGSTAQKVGQQNPVSWRTYSCGKKCSAPISDWKDFYVCLRCGN